MSSIQIGRDDDYAPCTAGCVNGFIPCPDHTIDDGDTANPFCVVCDQSIYVENPIMGCEECE